MPNCRAAAYVLRRSLAKRSASALNASSYLRHLAGDVPLVFAAITEEIDVLLLSALPGPHHKIGYGKGIGAFRRESSVPNVFLKKQMYVPYFE